jgi:hypothetical protein
MRKIFGHKRDETLGVWRKLHNEELHNLPSSPGVMVMLKSRRMRWAGHITCMRARKTSYSVLVQRHK